MTDVISVDFAATINIFPQDVEDAAGDLAQAVQNVVGGTGVQVYPETVEKS